MQPEPDKNALPGNTQSHFAWIRTRLAAMRTLESWVRTATSLIAFGFTMVQFFDRFDKMPGVKPPRIPGVPRIMGLLLVITGTVALAIAIWQYISLTKYLRSGPFRELDVLKGVKEVPALLGVAIFLCLIGIGALVILIYRSD